MQIYESFALELIDFTNKKGSDMTQFVINLEV